MKWFLPVFALAGSIAFTSCSDDDDSNGTPAPPAGPTQNIVEIALDSPQYSILVEALTATQLVSVLESEGPFTVFAPDNDAFNTFFDAEGIEDENNDGSRVDDLANAIGVQAVSAVLLYHVLGASIPAAQVPENAYVTTASTASPGDNQLSLLVQSGAGVTLNGSANVNAPDIFATNGVIHGIDAVLTLPTIVDHAINNPALFEELVGAVAAAGLVETLSGDGPFTVFAPRNDAFESIAEVVAGLTVEQLTTVLTYHTVTGNVRSENLADGPVTTISGQDVTVDLGDQVFIFDTQGDGAVVLTPDVQGTNGVVHLIDRVLIPQL